MIWKLNGGNQVDNFPVPLSISFDAVKECIDKNITTTFTLEYLAKYAGIKLTTGFRQVYGDTMFNYLREARLLKAKELLETSRLSEPVIVKTGEL